ncbi:TadE/TadG family type IV pilus assembly protein [Micromonospora zamorensis]|uniref:TadE/TadG family type IV pilus assembly protein n=1 Tax=Micromonospora zamorensis TaxID=709883 RepID=UPI002E1FE378
MLLPDRMSCWRRACRWQMRPADQGSSPVELAIVAPVVLLLAFMVVQAALVYWAHSIALGAATQGVTVERGYRAAPGSGATHAREFLAAAGDGLTDQQVTVTRTGTEVQVTVTGRAVSVLPVINFRVSRTAHGSIERVTTP